MKKINLTIILTFLGILAMAQGDSTEPAKTKLPASKVDFDAYDRLLTEVKSTERTD